VKFVKHADNKKVYTDFRRVLERKDIDVVAIATPPHWHALISIAAMEAGKDVLCEKPMTRFIAEGRAVAEAEKRYNRIFQIGTYGRFGRSRNPGDILTHKIMKSGLLKPCKGAHIKRGGLKVREWSGMVNAQPKPIPDTLDWDMYCGPSPLRSFHPHRFGDFDPVQWTFAKDDTSPVEIEAFAPPAHPEACGMWGWIELKYADGFTIVMDSTEWPEDKKPSYNRKENRGVSLSDLSEEDQKKIKEMPDPEPLVGFPEAIRTRKQAGGHAAASTRCVSLMHLANIAIRTGRKIHYDPVKEEIIGDEEPNRLVNPPRRAPWDL
jgi:hypothetical protein